MINIFLEKIILIYFVEEIKIVLCVINVFYEKIVLYLCTFRGKYFLIYFWKKLYDKCIFRGYCVYF